MIVTSTVSGLYGVPARAAYSSSKSALHAVFDPSGFFVKVLRLFAPAFLEKKMFEKLYHDFHH